MNKNTKNKINNYIDEFKVKLKDEIQDRVAIKLSDTKENILNKVRF